MSEAYAQVIEMLANESVDYKIIAVGLAKVAPDLFLALRSSKADLSDESLADRKMDQQILEWYRGGQKVTGIKFCRDRTGWGLKEAKDYCDALALRGMSNATVATDDKSVAVALSRIRDALAKQDTTGPANYKDGGSF